MPDQGWAYGDLWDELGDQDKLVGMGWHGWMGCWQLDGLVLWVTVVRRAPAAQKFLGEKRLEIWLHRRLLKSSAS